ncbi:MAG: hypothetical protein V7637_4665 [Mycobacteriales bacterium]
MSAVPVGEIGQVLDRVRHLHRMGVDATGDGRPVVAARHLRAGLVLLDRLDGTNRSASTRTAVAPDHASRAQTLQARLLISLALAEAEQGRTGAGLLLVDQAAPLLPAADHGVLLQQKGLLMLRLGRVDDAIRLLDEAIPLLERAGDAVVLTPTLLNRALVHIDIGKVRVARQDLSRCTRLARRHGWDLLRAKAIHNGGLCDLINGDIPAALAAFELAAQLYAQLASGFLPILTVDRAKALLAAGLGAEAGRELEGAVEQFRRQGLTQDLAEAELRRAQAALATGDLAAAQACCRRAERGFRRRGNLTSAHLARLMRLRVDLAAGTGRAAGQAIRLAQSLAEHGLSHDAGIATLVGIRGFIRQRRTTHAERLLGTLPPPRRGAPLDLRLLWRVTRAELSLARGRHSAALVQLRAGLRLLQDYRSRFGSLDLQVGAGTLGVELAHAGLDIAVQTGSAALVFAWSERSRAQVFRIRPVRAPTDPATADALAELRQLRSLSREAELQGRRDPRTQSRCAALERRIIERDRHLPGTRYSTPVTTAGPVIRELGDGPQVIVSIVKHQGRLTAQLLGHGQIQSIPLGDSTVAEETQRRLLSDLDSLAGRHLPARLADAVRSSTRHHTDILTRELLMPWIDQISDDDLVIIPPVSLAAMPWALLPRLRGRPVTVAPSASTWLGGRPAKPRRPPGDDPPGGPTAVLVAGPGLAHAEREIDAISAIHPNSRAIRQDEATVQTVLQALNGVPVAHIAAHGHHHQENVLFSCLDLIDGPLMAYDVYGLNSPPTHVVLSACDVGQTVVSPGDEILGFTAALLYAGTRTVISSVARVPDETAADVMSAYHKQLAAGAEPAHALAFASLANPLASFVCFGAG